MADLIDTDIVVYGIKSHEVVQRHFVESAHAPKAVPLITYGEILFGAKKSRTIEKNMAAVFRIGEILPVIEVTRSAISTFAETKARLRKQGRTFFDFDLLIAATAQSINYVLPADNERRFRRVPGLRVENWTKRGSK